MLAAKEGKGSKRRGIKARRDHVGDYHFRKLTLKMVGLSNMLNLMNVTKEVLPSNHQLSNNLGGIHKPYVAMAESMALLTQKSGVLEGKALATPYVSSKI